MKNKKSLFLFATAIFSFVVALSVTMVGKVNKLPNVVTGNEEEYTITLDGNNAAAGLTNSFAMSVAADAVTNGDYTLNLRYLLAKAADGAHVQLAPHGLIYNEPNDGAYANRVTSLKKITANFSGALTLKTSIRNDGKEYGKAVALTSGTAANLTTNPYYFMLEAGDDGATIQSIVLTYSCGENAGVYLDDLKGTYTGYVGGVTYKLTLNGASNNTIETLDKATNDVYNNLTASVSGNVLTITNGALTYTATVGNDHYKLTATNANLPIDFYKVYLVEDFESYSAQGVGYDSSRGANSIYSMTGLRSQYYSDYYGSNTVASPIGGSGWSLMGSTDYLQFTASKGLNGSKAASFKGNTNSLRYLQMKVLPGLTNVIGRGAYISFWAKNYSNSGLSTISSSNADIKMYAYYNKAVTPANQGTRTEQTFTLEAGADWTRYVMPLDTAKEYYAFGFYCKYSSTGYTVIDNVEIYTHNPYAEPPVAVTGVSLNTNSISLTRGASQTLVATVAPNNATNKNVTWTSSNSSVATVGNDGTVTAVAAGSATITATTADGGFTATCTVEVTEPVTVYPTGTFVGSATVLGSNYNILISIGTASNGLVAVELNNTDAEATGITFNTSTHQFTITTTGSYSSMKYGNITGTYDTANDRLTNVACDGGISSYVSNNGSITCSKPSALYGCDGTTAQLQSLFKRRYMSGSWQVDTGNADRITSNTTEYVTGTGAVKRRGYSGGAVALNFNADFSPAKTVANVVFWVYNPSGSDITLRMWGYKATNFGSNFETGSVTAKASGWTHCKMGFTSAAIYNFQIADFNNTGTYLTFDDIALF